MIDVARLEQDRSGCSARCVSARPIADFAVTASSSRIASAAEKYQQERVVGDCPRRVGHFGSRGLEVVLRLGGTGAVEQGFAALFRLQARAGQCLVECDGCLSRLIGGDPHIAGGGQKARLLRVVVLAHWPLLRKPGPRLQDCPNCSPAERGRRTLAASRHPGRRPQAPERQQLRRRGQESLGRLQQRGDGAQDRVDLMRLRKPMAAALDDRHLHIG